MQDQVAITREDKLKALVVDNSRLRTHKVSKVLPRVRIEEKKRIYKIKIQLASIINIKWKEVQSRRGLVKKNKRSPTKKVELVTIKASPVLYKLVTERKLTWRSDIAWYLSLGVRRIRNLQRESYRYTVSEWSTELYRDKNQYHVHGTLRGISQKHHVLLQAIERGTKRLIKRREENEIINCTYVRTSTRVNLYIYRPQRIFNTQNHDGF